MGRQEVTYTETKVTCDVCGADVTDISGKECDDPTEIAFQVENEFGRKFTLTLRVKEHDSIICNQCIKRILRRGERTITRMKG